MTAIIHRYWQGPDNPPAEPWLGQVLHNLHRGFEVCDWDDDTLPPEALAIVDDSQVVSSDLPRHRANVLRWWLLLTFGGVWLDHDVIPLVPLTTAGPWTATIGRRPTACAVSLPRGHGLALSMLDAITHTQEGRGTRCVNVSGDHLYARVIEGFPDVVRRPLPLDSLGNPTGSPAWALHLWATSSKRLRRASA